MCEIIKEINGKTVKIHSYYSDESGRQQIELFVHIGKKDVFSLCVKRNENGELVYYDKQIDQILTLLNCKDMANVVDFKKDGVVYLMDEMDSP